MGHPFGDLLTHYRSRRHGLTQARLADAIGYDATVIGRMAQGRRELTGPSGRERVLRIITALREAGALGALDEANALLAAAGLAPLFDGSPDEAQIQGLFPPPAAEPAMPPPRAAPPALPTPLTPLLGRAHELAQLAELSAANRLITIVGPGGVGKTHLALTFGQHASQPLRDGACMIDLSAAHEPAQALARIAAALGARDDGSAPVLGALRAAVYGRSMLILLDNCEQVAAAAAEAAEALLAASPGVHVLATSREPLGARGEATLALQPLAVPGPRDDAPACLACGAVQLFMARASAIGHPLAADAQAAETVARICRQLDGLPLAIELVVPWLRTLGIDELAARLPDALALPSQGSRTAPARHQTLRAAIDWSFALLTPPERELLARLSVLAGTWTLRAAEAVCGAGALPAADVLSTLSGLISKSLVFAEAAASGTRYHMLNTVRQYARARLDAAGETGQIVDRHADFYLAFVESAAARLRGAAQLDALADLDREEDNLDAAMRAALEDPDPLCALRLAGALWLHWYLRGRLRHGRDLLDQAMARAGPAAGGRPYARALLGRAWLDNEDGREAARYEQAAALCRDLGDDWGRAFALRGIAAGMTTRQTGEGAEGLLAESRRLFEAAGDPWGVALVLHSLGWQRVFHDRGESLHAWRMAHQLFTDCGDRWGRAITLNGLSFISRQEGALEQAESEARSGLSLFRELGDRMGSLESLTRLAIIALRRDDYAQTRSLLESSKRVRHELGEPADDASSLDLLATAIGFNGDIERATQLAGEALERARAAEDRSTEATVLETLGALSMWRGDFDRSRALFEASQVIARELGSSITVAVLHSELGELELLAGHAATAREQFARALALCDGNRDRVLLATCRNALGRLAVREGDFSAARVLLGQGLRARAAFGVRRLLAESFEACAGLAAAQGQPERTARLLGRADALRSAIGVPRTPSTRVELAVWEQRARRDIGDAAFEEGLRAGAALTDEAAIADALGGPDHERAAPAASDSA